MVAQPRREGDAVTWVMLLRTIMFPEAVSVAMSPPCSHDHCWHYTGKNATQMPAVIVWLTFTLMPVQPTYCTEESLTLLCEPLIVTALPPMLWIETLESEMLSLPLITTALTRL